MAVIALRSHTIDKKLLPRFLLTHASLRQHLHAVYAMASSPLRAGVGFFGLVNSMMFVSMPQIDLDFKLSASKSLTGYTPAQLTSNRFSRFSLLASKVQSSRWAVISTSSFLQVTNSTEDENLV